MGDAINTAKVGDRFADKALKNIRRKLSSRIADHIEKDPVVREKSDAKEGQWACLDCGEFFQNNMGVQMHTKTHRAVWWTGDHAEEP